MRLIELLEKLNEQAGSGVIYIDKNRPRAADSAVLVMPEDHNADQTARTYPDYEYLIEVFLAEEIIQVWSDWRGNREANGRDKCDAVLYYAENDAYLPNEVL